jgi:hypothetical protein
VKIRIVDPMIAATATFLGFAGRAADTVERILTKSFAAALTNSGWAPVWRGGKLRFRRDTLELDVAAEILMLKTRQTADWHSRCEALGIGGLVLLPVPELPGRGCFCSRCLRAFASAVEFCPVCRKRIYA